MAASVRRAPLRALVHTESGIVPDRVPPPTPSSMPATISRVKQSA